MKNLKRLLHFCPDKQCESMFMFPGLIVGRWSRSRCDIITVFFMRYDDFLSLLPDASSSVHACVCLGSAIKEECGFIGGAADVEL